MERKTQNLFLFFEETDDEKDTSSKLVRLYMNRFVIDEEDQTEIIGAYNLSKANENKAKREHDKSLFEKLGSEIESFRPTGQNFMDHFLIGSSYYIKSSGSIVKNWIDEIYRSYHNEVKKYFREIESEISSSLCTEDELNRLEGRLDNNISIEPLLTILSGSQSNLLTAAQVKLAHQSESEFELINNDLEEYHQLIMTRTKELKIDDSKSLSFYKQLIDPDVEKLKSSLIMNRTYEIELNQQNWTTEKSLEALLPLLAKTDPGYQYLQCDCQRYSFSQPNECKGRIWKLIGSIRTSRQISKIKHMIWG